MTTMQRDEHDVEGSAVRQRTARERIAFFFAFCWLGLQIPDLDQLALPILHHRSIVTHGVFIPLALLLWRPYVLGDLLPGLVVGIAIHLAADLTSPSQGFGGIWLPWPLKLSLGELSFLWLFGNAVVGIAWFRTVMLRRSHTERLVSMAIGLAIAAVYAIYIERTVAAFLLLLAAGGAGYAVAPYLARSVWFVRLTIWTHPTTRPEREMRDRSA